MSVLREAIERVKKLVEQANTQYKAELSAVSVWARALQPPPFASEEAEVTVTIRINDKGTSVEVQGRGPGAERASKVS